MNQPPVSGPLGTSVRLTDYLRARAEAEPPVIRSQAIRPARSGEPARQPVRSSHAAPVQTAPTPGAVALHTPAVPRLAESALLLVPGGFVIRRIIGQIVGPLRRHYARRAVKGDDWQTTTLWFVVALALYFGAQHVLTGQLALTGTGEGCGVSETVKTIRLDCHQGINKAPSP